MAHQPISDLYTILGTVIWGDLGPVTIYRNKQGKVVWYAKTFPEKPPSPAQLAQRQKFKSAANAWQLLTPTQHEQWNLATQRASLCATGYDLYVHWYLTRDDAALATLARQTGTTLIP